MIDELRRLIAEIEARQADCDRRLLHVKEAMALVRGSQERVRGRLPPDSTGYRLFDRMLRERTFYWSEGSTYVEAKDCRNLKEFVGVLIAVVKELEPDIDDLDTLRADLIRELEAQRGLMIAVSTGGPRINEVNGEYLERRTRLAAGLSRVGLADPSPYDDLWAWYGKWSADLPSYRSRREYLADLFAPVVYQLRGGATPSERRAFPEPTGWVKVDRNLGGARVALSQAKVELDHQKVGLVCRETLTDLTQEVFVPDRHPTEDGVAASPTDAKRMLDAYLMALLPGAAHELPRRHARTALALANELTHKRTASFRDAALCIEATASVVNIIAIISGHRDPDRGGA